MIRRVPSWIINITFKRFAPCVSAITQPLQQAEGPVDTAIAESVAITAIHILAAPIIMPIKFIIQIIRGF